MSSDVMYILYIAKLSMPTMYTLQTRTLSMQITTTPSMQITTTPSVQITGMTMFMLYALRVCTYIYYTLIWINGNVECIK